MNTVMEKSKPTGTKERAFYIRVINKNVKNGKPLFVGPFKSIEDANLSIEDALNEGQELVKGNDYINDQTLNVDIVGITVAKREGMKQSLGEIPTIDLWETYFPGGDMIKSGRGRPKKFESSKDDSKDEVIKEDKRSSRITSTTSGSNVKEKLEKLNTSTSANTDTNKGNKTKKQTEVIIVSGNIGIINWLSDMGYTGEIISFVSNRSQIEGKVVIGVLPPWWAHYAKENGVPNIPGLSKDITADEIREKGGRIDWYKTMKIDR